MGRDEDIAAFLPEPPPPAPARREVAIGEAMRRFDGEAERAVAPAGRPSAARPAWWSRPYAGAFAAAALVAILALPLVWTAFPDGWGGERGEPRQPAPIGRPAPDIVTRSEPPARPVPAPSPAEAAVASADMAAPVRPEPRAPQLASKSAPAPAMLPAPAPPPPPQLAEVARETSPLESRDDIVVSGSRIARPNLSSPTPITVVDNEHIHVTGSRAARPVLRGDWNACTIDDPARDLARCGRLGRGAVAAHLTEGLSRAWEGEVEEAIAAFDKAIAAAPRSAPAYLNRGLTWRRQGELDRALADLDRAVSLAPREARYYFARSLILRQQGVRRRARADEARAVELDPRYDEVVSEER